MVFSTWSCCYIIDTVVASIAPSSVLKVQSDICPTIVFFKSVELESAFGICLKILRCRCSNG